MYLRHSNVVQAAYSSVAQGFGAMPGTSSGYGQAYAQAALPFGQSVNSFQAGQKRDAGYDQASLILPSQVLSV